MNPQTNPNIQSEPKKTNNPAMPGINAPETEEQENGQQDLNPRKSSEPNQKESNESIEGDRSSDSDLRNNPLHH